MLNETHVEGVVNKTWEFGGTRFARVACYPDAGRSVKRNGSRQKPEYITLRFEHPLALGASTLQSGDRVRASGFLASRDYDIPLPRLAETAKGDPVAVEALRQLAAQYGDRLRKPHVLNEVAVERFAKLRPRPRVRAQ